MEFPHHISQVLRGTSALVTLVLTLTARTPEVRGELPAVESVTAEEGEHAARSVVSAVHALCLKLQMKLQRLVQHHICQGRLSFERSRAEKVCLSSLVHVEPICTLRFTDLQQNEER